MFSAPGWFVWALLSAVFAALTAILAKLGLRGVDSDFATLMRTAIILPVLTGFVMFNRKWSSPLALPGRTLYSPLEIGWRTYAIKGFPI